MFLVAMGLGGMKCEGTGILSRRVAYSKRNKNHFREEGEGLVQEEESQYIST